MLRWGQQLSQEGLRPAQWCRSCACRSVSHGGRRWQSGENRTSQGPRPLRRRTASDDASPLSTHDQPQDGYSNGENYK